MSKLSDHISGWMSALIMYDPFPQCPEQKFHSSYSSNQNSKKFTINIKQAQNLFIAAYVKLWHGVFKQRECQGADKGITGKWLGKEKELVRGCQRSNKGLTRGRLGADKRPTMGRQGDNTGPTRGHQGTNKLPTSCQQGAEKGPT